MDHCTEDVENFNHGNRKHGSVPAVRIVARHRTSLAHATAPPPPGFVEDVAVWATMFRAAVRRGRLNSSRNHVVRRVVRVAAVVSRHLAVAR